jgi:hypothetical protein
MLLSSDFEHRETDHLLSIPASSKDDLTRAGYRTALLLLDWNIPDVEQVASILGITEELEAVKPYVA